MAEHGTSEYRRNMAAIHDEVVRSGTEVVVTKDGQPYVKVVPASREAVLQRLADQGRISLPARQRQPVEPVDAGGDDTTEVVAASRR